MDIVSPVRILNGVSPADNVVILINDGNAPRRGQGIHPIISSVPCGSHCVCRQDNQRDAVAICARFELIQGEARHVQSVSEDERQIFFDQRRSPPLFKTLANIEPTGPGEDRHSSKNGA